MKIYLLILANIIGALAFNSSNGVINSTVSKSTAHMIQPTASNTSMHSTPATSMTHSSMATSVPPMNSTSIHPSTHHSSPVPRTTTVPTTKPPVTTPRPDPKVHFQYKNCVKMVGDVLLVVNYMSAHNGMEEQHILLTQADAQVSGKCSDLKSPNDTAFIEVVWRGLGYGNGTKMNESMRFTIEFTGGETWYMSGINVTIFNRNKTVFNTTESKVTGTMKLKLDKDGSLYQAPRNHSYTCPIDHAVELQSDNKMSYNITVDFKSILFQPFVGSKSTSVSQCPAKTSEPSGNSIVPIAVGCALAGLIVIVLIAYLIGRRKGSNRGYQQV